MALSKPARSFIDGLIPEFKECLAKFKSKTSDRSTRPELDEQTLELLQSIDRTAVLFSSTISIDPGLKSVVSALNKYENQLRELTGIIVM